MSRHFSPGDKGLVLIDGVFILKVRAFFIRRDTFIVGLACTFGTITPLQAYVDEFIKPEVFLLFSL